MTAFLTILAGIGLLALTVLLGTGLQLLLFARESAAARRAIDELRLEMRGRFIALAEDHADDGATLGLPADAPGRTNWRLN